MLVVAHMRTVINIIEQDDAIKVHNNSSIFQSLKNSLFSS